MSARPLAFVAALAAVLGCGDDIPDVGADTSTGLPDGTSSTASGGGPSSAVGTDEGPSADNGPDDGPDSGDTGFEPPEVVCGNGFIERGEQCDDGNRDDGDACNNACQVPCGLEISTITLPPTDDSVISADFVAASPDGGTVVAGLLRVITTDQRGNQDIEPDVAQVMHFDAAGRQSWTVTVDNPEGDLNANGVVVDTAGDVFVAATGDDPDGADGIVVVKLAGDTGEEVWRHTYAGEVVGADDLATGIALTAEGDVVVAGQVRVGEGDDDIWVRRLAAGDGTEQWTASYSGTGTAMFSTDDGGPVAVDTDGRVWVFGIEYVDFETQAPVVLRIAADGSEVEVMARPALSGSQQAYFIVDLATGDDNAVYAVYGRNLITVSEFRITRYDGGGTEIWTLTDEAFEVGIGSNWQPVGIAPQGEKLVVAGQLSNDVTIDDASWSEVWVARLLADGVTRCQAQYRGQAPGLLPPSIFAADVAVNADAEGLVSGVQSIEGDFSLWLGRFRSE
ncbi:MAG: hypothetical protein JKY37_13050 [Nannocystaceae bacterium]|nr:hypothetical protein [Nannocystaceae bacterium]